MRRIVIVGAGGHGREVAEILAHQGAVEGNLEVLGFVDENPALKGEQIGRLPVLGDWGWFDGVDRSEVSIVCAVGRPAICKKLATRALELGFSLENAVSPKAWISPTAHLGKGLTIFPNTIINTEAIIGDGCILNVNVSVSHDTMVGSFCNLNPGANLAGNVKVGEGCYIGMGAKIIQGISIGAWSIIGAGAVVIHDISEKVTAVGVPATVIKKL